LFRQDQTLEGCCDFQNSCDVQFLILQQPDSLKTIHKADVATQEIIFYFKQAETSITWSL
jgi:hypothetical protein